MTKTIVFTMVMVKPNKNTKNTQEHTKTKIKLGLVNGYAQTRAVMGVPY